MPNPPRSYTRAEKVTRARLLAVGSYRSAGDTSRIEKQLDAIDKRAEERARVEAEELAKARAAEMRRKAAEKAARKVRRGR